VCSGIPWQAKRPVRKERVGDDESWSLSRFTPLVQDLVEEVAEDKLPRDQYVYVKEPATPPQRLAREDTAAQQAKAAARPSARTARTANWAKNAPKEE
jgi:syntaxin-binding protein 1